MDLTQTGSLYLKYLPFLFLCFVFLNYNFILTSKDICTALDYCCISVNFGVVTVVKGGCVCTKSVPLLCSRLSEYFLYVYSEEVFFDGMIADICIIH